MLVSAAIDFRHPIGEACQSHCRPRQVSKARQCTTLGPTVSASGNATAVQPSPAV